MIKMRSYFLPLIFILLLTPIAPTYLMLEPVQAAEEPGYYAYDETTTSWTWIPQVWVPTSREKKTMRTITICVKGLSPDIATNIKVDDSPVGTIQGSGCRSFVVSKDKGHTFCVDEEISGDCSTYEGKTVCTRFKCPGNCWTVEAVKKERVCESVPICDYECRCPCPCPDDCVCPKPLCEGCVPPPCDCCPCTPSCQYICYYFQQCHYEEEDVEQSYTFEYFAEHQVSVSNSHGNNIEEWAKDKTTVNFFAKEEIQLKDEKTVKERDIFEHWMINGAPNENPVISVSLIKPFVAVAKYKNEIQYRIEVSSDIRKSRPEGTGWYLKGKEATISIEEEVPLEGWKGSLGGKYIFFEWRGNKGTVLRDPISNLNVEEDQKLEAIFEIDDWLPMMILYALIILIIIIALIILYRLGYISKKKRVQKKSKTETSEEIEKLKAEIRELKKETLAKKQSSKRRK